MRLFRFILFGLLLLVGLRLLLAKPRHAEPQVGDRVIVDYWEKWGGAEAAAMQQIIELFNDTVGREKGIYVRYLSMSDIQRKTLVSTAAGVPPDLAGIFEAQVAQYAELEALEPLDELAAEYGITVDHYKPVYWEMCTFRGRLWGLMSTPSSLGLLYNKRVFRANAVVLRAGGCDPHRAPRTIAELDRYAELLDTRDPRNPRRIDRAGFLPLEPNWFVNYYPYYFGGDLYDAATDRITIATDPAVRQCFEWMQRYARRLGVDAMNEFSSGFGGFASTQNPFFAEKITMTLQGPWMANYTQIYRPDMCEVIVPKALEPLLPRMLRVYNYDWGVDHFPCDATLPAGPRPAYCGGDVLVIPRGARHKREAFEFIAFVQRQDVMEKLCAAQTKLSPLRAVSDEFLRTHPNPYIHVFDAIAASPLAKGPQQLGVFPEMTEQVNFMTQRLMALEATVDEMLEQSQRRLEAKYALYKDRQRARIKQ